MCERNPRNLFIDVYKIEGKTFSSIPAIAEGYKVSLTVAQRWVRERLVDKKHFIRRVKISNTDAYPDIPDGNIYG